MVPAVEESPFRESMYNEVRPTEIEVAVVEEIKEMPKVRKEGLEGDYEALKENPIPGVKLISSASQAKKEWLLRINGPKGVFEGGVFRLSFMFPADYPKTAPTCKFRTKIYHP